MLGAETWLTYRLVIILFERMGVGRVDSRNIPIPNPEKALGPELGSNGGGWQGVIRNVPLLLYDSRLFHIAWDQGQGCPRPLP